MITDVVISRVDNRIPWGFRLQGGLDFNQCLSIKKVEPDSLAANARLLIGDQILKINGIDATKLRHQAALQLFRSAGDVLELLVIRNTRNNSVVSHLDEYPQPDSGELSTVVKLERGNLEQGNQRETKLAGHFATNSSINNYRLDSIMATQPATSQESIPDQLLSQFNKRPEDKPFSYLPSGGMAELQQRQRSVPPPVRPKPKPARQSSHNPNSSNSSQASYEHQSLFTPAYQQLLKQQQNYLQYSSPAALPADAVGVAPDQVPPDAIAAYVLQSDGSMVAYRWNDRPDPKYQDSAVMSALLEEQEAQLHGHTTGKIQSTGGPTKQGLSFRVLQWLTGTDSEDNSETTSNYSGSHDSYQMLHSPGARKIRQQSFDKTDLNQYPIKEESPLSSEGKQKRNALRIVSKGASLEKYSQPIQPVIQDDVAFSDL